MLRLAMFVIPAFTGCVPMAPRIYVPLEGNAIAVAGRMCEPSYKMQLFEQSGTVIALVVRPNSEAFSGSVLVDVPAGKSLQFQSALLTIEGAGKSALSATLNPGRYLAREKLEGFTVAEFPFTAMLPSSPTQIKVTMPNVEIDQTPVQVKPATFVLRRQPMVVGLCQ